MKTVKMVLMAVMVLSLVSTTFATVTTMAWYRGGEADSVGSTNAVDSSGNGFDLAAYGTPVMTTGTGVTGSSTAYSFDGTSYFKYNAPVTTTIYNWGIEAWVNPSTVADEFAVSIGDDHGGYSLFISDGKFMGLLNGRTVLEGPAATPNVWTHVAFINTKTSDTDNLVKLYVNGNLVASANTFPRDFDSEAVTTVGAYAGGGHYFHGNIDEARVFTFEPEAFEVSDLLYPAVPEPITLCLVFFGGMVGLSRRNCH